MMVMCSALNVPTYVFKGDKNTQANWAFWSEFHCKATNHAGDHEGVKKLVGIDD